MVAACGSSLMIFFLCMLSVEGWNTVKTDGINCQVCFKFSTHAKSINAFLNFLGTCFLCELARMFNPHLLAVISNVRFYEFSEST